MVGELEQSLEMWRKKAGVDRNQTEAYEKLLCNSSQHLLVADRLHAIFCSEGDIKAGFLEGLVWDCSFCIGAWSVCSFSKHLGLLLHSRITAAVPTRQTRKSKILEEVESDLMHASSRIARTGRIVTIISHYEKHLRPCHLRHRFSLDFKVTLANAKVPKEGKKINKYNIETISNKEEIS